MSRALLTHDDVVTLFHEFGHGMHHLLTRVGYPTLAGINGVAWDAVELPSQFMENYAWHPQVLRRIAAHVTQRRAAARSAAAEADHARAVSRPACRCCGSWNSRCLISRCMPATTRRAARASRRCWPRCAPAWRSCRCRSGTASPTASAHIFAGGYAAGYYSYKWAEVLAADAFAAFEETDVFDPDTARRFVDCILSQGGSRDALDAFVAFRGRKPDVRPLLRQHGIAA